MTITKEAIEKLTREQRSELLRLLNELRKDETTFWERHSGWLVPTATAVGSVALTSLIWYYVTRK